MQDFSGGKNFRWSLFLLSSHEIRIPSPPVVPGRIHKLIAVSPSARSSDFSDILRNKTYPELKKTFKNRFFREILICLKMSKIDSKHFKNRIFLISKIFINYFFLDFYFTMKVHFGKCCFLSNGSKWLMNQPTISQEQLDQLAWIFNYSIYQATICQEQLDQLVWIFMRWWINLLEI